MGSSSSLFSFMTEEMLDEYVQLTYLSRTEIFHLLKKFLLLTPDGKIRDPEYRYPLEFIVEVFPQLKYNPFRDRIFKVFSSLKDDRFSFEDMLDLCSVMSENCPDHIKARWAFEIFDFNEDGLVDKEDIDMAIERLTQGKDAERVVEDEEKNHIITVLLKAMDLQGNGSINQLEFEHAVGKMSEFPSSFSFRI
ncbi:hypothetical protein ILUMI_04766 [Ignelater luminosus]|uniref:EF-hand domain-containing protein n=1 Tax=Ignelater luminosus TaxID=2038154 RepID=A0A8K0D912_IGNLU|nr:hypothetical protein ILUMI_04766 [Ignelater luminosus]